MTSPACSRLWQVEAIRDGRLSGKDLELAERHREHCPECAGEARRLLGLTHDLSSLPALPRDPLSVRRSRQRLMSAVNESLVASPPKRSPRWAAALLLLPAAAGYALFLRHSAPEAVADLPKSAVEVLAKAGARWVIRSTAALEQVELSDGEATFKVHPHAARRVLIQLPDGELEDLGTTFEVVVRDQHTSHIAVSEGRVAVRLSSQPEFLLGAGEHWERAAAVSPLPPPSASVATSNERAPIALRANEPRAVPRHPAKAPSPTPEPKPSAAPDSESTRAEDTAYLGVVSLLRQGRDAEARQQAKAYLLRFPSGFRRVEMLNVATRSDNEPAQ